MKTSDLKYIAPNITAEKLNVFLPLLNQYMHEYNICGQLRESAFIATIMHETGSLRWLEEIASGDAYEDRKDLGNVIAGDGRKYKGRGLIMITGRSNYERASKALGVDLIGTPELASQPEQATMIACWWWYQRGLNEVADTGDFRRVTRLVNGGYTGMTDRQKFYDRALEVLKL